MPVKRVKSGNRRGKRIYSSNARGIGSKKVEIKCIVIKTAVTPLGRC